MLNVERKKFLKLIDELLGPIVPAFLGLVLEGNSQIRGEGGGIHLLLYFKTRITKSPIFLIQFSR